MLGTCRTEYMSPHLVSVRVNEKAAAAAAAGITPAATGPEGAPPEDNKKIAYLLDAQTVRRQTLAALCPRPRPHPTPRLPACQIRILDLVSGATSATVNHDSRVDWLELNSRGSLLLFRDKRRRLHLYDVARQQRSTLLSYCNYAQWVPDSDVVVAQRRSQLCVWYNIRAPEKMTSYDIKGDVEDIERGNGKTEVIVDEGITTASYMLDEGLIAFSEGGRGGGGCMLDDGTGTRLCELGGGLRLRGITRAPPHALQALRSTMGTWGEPSRSWRGSS